MNQTKNEPNLLHLADDDFEVNLSKILSILKFI